MQMKVFSFHPDTACFEMFDLVDAGYSIFRIHRSKLDDTIKVTAVLREAMRTWPIAKFEQRKKTLMQSIWSR